MKPVEWHYQLIGSGNKPPLVFLHGFLGSLRDWDFACDYWKKSRRCITVDLPGHGRTRVRDVEFYSMEETAACLVKLMNEMGISQSHLVGYSMGGRLALYMAIHYPEKFTKLVLESASPGLRTETERRKRRELDEILAASLLHQGMGKFLVNWYEQPLFRVLKSHPQFNLLLRERMQNNPAALALSLRRMGTGSQPSLWPELQKIRQSILLLVGEHDQKFSRLAIQMQKENGNFSVKVIENCGHTVHFEKKGDFLSEIDRFINS